ncbi:hypothetical protein FRB90_001581 [Tulasnella sp. 427]|nr:hypothetical protein FRB90_001581 [Tulasnella sp. 427]
MVSAVKGGTAVNKAALAVDQPRVERIEAPQNTINEFNRAVPVRTEPMEVATTAPSAAASRDLQMILVQSAVSIRLKDLSACAYEADGRILAKSPESIAALLDFAALPPV